MKSALLVILLTCGISWAEQPAKGAAVVEEKTSSGDTKANASKAQAKPAETPAPTKAVVKNAAPEDPNKDDERPPSVEVRAVAEFKSFIATYNNFWIALLMAAIAGVQAWFFWRQLNHMKQSNDTASKAAQAALNQTDYMVRSTRAYVLADKFRLDKDLLKGNICATIRFQNFGQSTAVKVRGCFYVNGFDLPYKGAFLEADFTDASQAPLGAGQGHAITVCLGGDEPFTTAAANLCISGKAAVYLWGTIIYEDVFRNEHRTHIRAISSGENFSTGEFEICEEGNEAD